MIRPGRRGLISAALVAVVIVLALSLWWFRRPALPEGFAAANGRLEATEADIATKRAGRLGEITVREGDSVSKEQVVARMEVRDLEADLHQARAEFQEAVQAKVATEARLAQQESAVEFAAAEFRRSESLVKQKLIPQQEADLARSKLDSERAGLHAARASVVQSEAAIDAAQARIEAIQTDLDDSILKSPIAGRVLYRLAEPGEVLAAGGKIITLLDLNDVYMTVFLPTAEAGRVQVGSEARIVLDAAPETPLPAQVSFISPEAQFTPKEVETRSEREKLMFRIKARLDPVWLTRHAGSVTAGLPGLVYVRLDPDVPWPESLRLPVTQNESAVWTTPSSPAE